MFTNRKEGGRRLASALLHYRQKPNTIVIGLPRGGVVTAAEVAEALDLPLDVLVIRKLGTPGQEELAMGAVGPGGARVLNLDVVRSLHVSMNAIEEETRREQKELDRREHLFRGEHPPINFTGKTVILVDDGLATGSTMEAAIAVVRRRDAARVVLAVPVAPDDTCRRLENQVDELVCLETPEPFMAVGCWYEDFAQVEDDEVTRILQAHTSASAVTA
ncbi:MAG TPA: phosphoribosyltransferase [Thermoanaerobaculia bacterium]|nr:phosphoribosyltransferase [Thermoanaerobaculia bacterium]